MKKSTLITLLACLITASSFATTVSFSGSSIFLSDGFSLVPQSSHISAGYFDGAFTDFAGLDSRTWTDINSADYIEVFSASVNPAGAGAGSGSATGIIGEKLYVWVFNSVGAPVGAVNTQEHGLFTGSDGAWTAEGDNFISDFNFLDVNIIDNAVYGSDLGANVSLAAAVPEPSAFALLAGAFGIAAVMVRRRR